MARLRAASPRSFAVRHGRTFARTAKPDQNFDVLVRELAERSVALTRKRLRIGSERWDAAELRGYVRARAAGIIRLQIRALVTDGHLPPEIAGDVAVRALEVTAHLVVRDILKSLVVSGSANSELRRAA